MYFVQENKDTEDNTVMKILSDDIVLRYCREDESQKIVNVLYEAFWREPLTRAFPYTDSFFLNFWSELINDKFGKMVILGAFSKFDDSELLGVIVIEPASVDEIEDSNIDYSDIYPDDYFLVVLRKRFWPLLFDKFPSEKLNMNVQNRYFRLSYLAVSPSAWGCGVARKLLNEIPRVIADIQNRNLDGNSLSSSPSPYIIYAEATSKASNKILGAHGGFETWTSFNYEDLRKNWDEFSAVMGMKEARVMGPCDEEEMFLLVKMHLGGNV